MFHLTLIAAQSLDGFITRHDESGTAFCSPEDQNYFLKALDAFDCQIMGRATYELSRNAIQRATGKDRLRIIRSRQPERFHLEEHPGSIEFSDSSPLEIVAELRERGKRQCALLGGAETYTAFLKADLVDSLWLTIEPRIFGDGAKLATDAMDARFKLERSETLSADTILLKYARPEDPSIRDAIDRL